VAVSAGYMNAAPRAEFYQHMDAANIDLKAFTESFYQKITFARLASVLETLSYLRETDVWFEITTLLIPGLNDSDDEIDRLTSWVVERLGADVPLHFTAFHPDYKLLDRPPTPPATLSRARSIALANGLRYAYTGNVFDVDGQSTYCPGCGSRAVERDWYRIGAYRMDGRGGCAECGTRLAGVFSGPPGRWGARRLPVTLSRPRGSARP